VKCVINMAAVSGRNVSVRRLEMQTETLVGLHVKCLYVVVVFLSPDINYVLISPILGLKLIKTDSSVLEYSQADRQT
jgi:hypothetical protein